MRWIPSLLLFATAVSAACPPPEPIDFEIERAIHRSRPAFTQGLVYRAGALVESVGGYGRSEINIIDSESGEVSRVAELPEEFFGEGLDHWNGTFFQLTWKERRALIWDEDLAAPPRSIDYRWEGWGVTHDPGGALPFWIVSDGSSILRLLDPATFSEKTSLEVRRREDAVRGLNELEWIEGKIYANLFPSSEVARIDPRSGCVDGVLDLSSLAEDQPGVVNGIARRPESGTVFVTGKNWTAIYELRLRPRGPPG